MAREDIKRNIVLHFFFHIERKKTFYSPGLNQYTLLLGLDFSVRPQNYQTLQFLAVWKKLQSLRR